MATTPPVNQSLLDRLREMGLNVGSSNPAPAPAPTPASNAWYSAVNDWQSSTSNPVPVSQRATNTSRPVQQTAPAPSGYYPQPQTYYQQPTYTQPRYTAPVQGPAPRPFVPPPPPRSTYKVDPLEAAVNQWQQSNQKATSYDPLSSAKPDTGYKAPTRYDPLSSASTARNVSKPQPFGGYDVKEPTFDYSTDSVDTGPSSFTAQQYTPPTRTTRSSTPLSDVQGPQAQPTGLNAWLPNNFASASPGPLQFAASQFTDPGNRNAWAEVAQRVGQQLGDNISQGITNFDPTATGQLGQAVAGAIDPLREDIADSAAYERFQFDTGQRNEAFSTRTNSTLGDVGEAFGEAAAAFKGNGKLFFDGLKDIADGTKSVAQVLKDNWRDVQFSPYLRPLAEATETTRPTAELARGAMNVLSGLQVAQDYANTGFDVANKAPLAPNIAALADEMGGNLSAFASDPLGSLTGENEDYKALGDFYQGWVERVGDYVQATLPDAVQLATNTAGKITKDRERAYLNALGGLEATTNTFDALADRPNQVNLLNQQAAAAWEAGAMTDDEEERQAHWQEAAQAGSDAWILENSHPQELVNQNTNILRQLLFEVIQPDITDAIGGLFVLAGATPKARRLASTTAEVMTPQQKVLATLDDVVATANINQRSNYNKLINLWTTGKARAEQATDAMHRYTVNLLADVETPGDARVLLNQLAVDPRKIITGMDAGVFQSTGVLNRADAAGQVRWGAMNLDKTAEPWQIYQQAAQNVLRSPALSEGPILNKVDFLEDFTDAMNEAGYRYYNVANEAANVPTGAVTGRLKAQAGGNYVVEFVNADKKIISTSEPMLIQDARKLKESVGNGTALQKSVIGEISQFSRALVSPFYILTSPGTWATNLIGGLATAAGDGTLALKSSKYIDNWTAKMFGVDPTQRGFRNIESAGSSASQFSSKGPLKFLKRAYSGIDEAVGKRVYYRAASDALRTVGKEVLGSTLRPVLAGFGLQPADANRIISHLHEVGTRGGDLTAEFNKLLTGQTRPFSLGEVNPTWTSAIPEEGLEGLYDIVRTAQTPDELVGNLASWADTTTAHWDELIASAPTPPTRYVWQKQEVLQDTADISQIGNKVKQYAGLAGDTVDEGVKGLAEGLTETQRRMRMLMDVVTDSADPANRYALYNVWGQVNDLTTNVRVRLSELAEQVNVVGVNERPAAWGNYWNEAQRLWTERNTTVNSLLDSASEGIARGDDFTPQLNQWDILERTARKNEQTLWDTLRLEPESGRYDARLAQVIDAGRVISDKAIGRTYAAARRFLEVDAMDYIVSAEHSVQMAGAQARAYLDKALEKALKSGRWEDYYSIRNETWRQLRNHEKEVWGDATRNIVREGIGAESTTGLRFDAGPDGVVELIGPRKAVSDAPNRMGPQKTTTTTERTMWDVRREDGSVTQLSDNYIPDDLKKKYNGVSDDEIEGAVELELDNIASALPYQADAERMMELNQRADELMDAMGEQRIPRRGRYPESQQLNEIEDVMNAPFPGSSQLDEAAAGRAEDVASGSSDARLFIREEWDRVAKANGLGNRLDQEIATYTRNGIVNVPENRFEDLYGQTVAGRRIESSADVDSLFQEYYNFGQQRSTPMGTPFQGDAFQHSGNRGDFATYDLNPDIPIVETTLKSERVPLGDALRNASSVYEWDALAITYKLPSKKTIADRLERGHPPFTKAQAQQLTGLQFGDTPLKDDMSLRVFARDITSRTMDMTIPSIDFEALAERLGIELNFGGVWGKSFADESRAINKATTTAGGATAGELAHGAAFAKQQIANIVDYIAKNADEILTPKGRLIGEGQNLQALDAFRREVLPAWDNAKYIASEYGNRMRSFTLVDFANNTRLDELMGLYMPYGFWMTRTVKNSMERAIFQPHIWRRVMQTEREMRSVQEQEGVPQRYEGTIPVDIAGAKQWLRLLPSKYWPTAGMFTMNDYANPEGANSAIGFATESLRAANLQGYPWWDAATKAWEGKTDEIYPAQYLPQGRIASDLAISMLGANAASRWTVPGYFENSVARTLNNMAVKGEITRDQARWAHDYLWQLKNGGEPLPEADGAYNVPVIESILDTAMRSTAGTDLKSALSSYLTGVSSRPFDEAERVWSGAAGQYQDNKYGPDNPYGSKLAADAEKPDAQLAWSKAGVWRDEEQRPGIGMATDAKKNEQAALNQTLMDATDAFITSFDGRPENYQINDFKNKWAADQLGGKPDAYYVETLGEYLDAKYPSATTFDGKGFQYDGYAPEEVRQAARRSAYYRAKDEIAQPVYPTYPGNDASRTEKNAYFAAKKVYDAEKAAYEQALETRVDELINDPQAMLAATGRPVMNPDNFLVNDFTRSQPQSLDDVFGYPVRPTGAGAIQPTQGPLTEQEFLAQQGNQPLWNVGLTPLAGDPANGGAIIDEERTKYMSPLEKETRAANAVSGSKSSSGGRGYSRKSYTPYAKKSYSSGGRGYSNYRPRYYSSSRRGYSSGGGGGGSAGGSYYVNPVAARGLSNELQVSPRYTGYEAPRSTQRLPDIGPDSIKAWRPLSW